jgi:hypothetical protein
MGTVLTNESLSRELTLPHYRLQSNFTNDR